MKKFEIVRKYDNVTSFQTNNIKEVPSAETISKLSDEECVFKIDYKVKTQQQVLNFIENHAAEISAKDEATDEAASVSKVSDLYPDTYNDREIPQEGTVVLYTRFMEDGRFKRTYTQIKTFDDFEAAKSFVDKKTAKKSKYGVGSAIVVDGRATLCVVQMMA